MKREILSNDIYSNFSINKNYKNINNFIMPTKTSFINKLLNSKKNISLINKKSNDESLLTISNITIASQYNESKKNKERQKNKSVEGIKLKKYNIFSHFLYQEILQKLSYKLNAAFIICVHNHPSGDVNPSQDDINVTKRIYEIGNLMGIKLVDHIIISENSYYSFLENGKI